MPKDTHVARRRLQGARDLVGAALLRVHFVQHLALAPRQGRHGGDDLLQLQARYLGRFHQADGRDLRSAELGPNSAPARLGAVQVGDSLAACGQDVAGERSGRGDAPLADRHDGGREHLLHDVVGQAPVTQVTESQGADRRREALAEGALVWKGHPGRLSTRPALGFGVHGGTSLPHFLRGPAGAPQGRSRELFSRFAGAPCNASPLRTTSLLSSMKPIVKWLLIPLASVATVLGLGATYLVTAFPKVPLPKLEVQPSPELHERGKYLAHHVSVCMDCHAERDWTRFSGPPKDGTLGHGGERFNREMGLPGDIVSKNITPGGIGSWSDAELARAITSGVSKDGHALFPIMPYPYYRHMCDRDLRAVISYVRSLPASDEKQPETVLDFPVNLIVRTMPEAPDPWECTAPGDEGHGKYLTTIAGCPECHTKQEKGQVVGERFAGGWRFPLPGGSFVTSKNITPDKETGIGNWTREQFVMMFRSRGKAESAFEVKPGGRQTVMPWNMYGGMSEEDLGAIYDYLRTIPAVKNQVEDFEPPK